MKLKGNFFAIIYTIVFFVLMGFGLLQMTNLTISTASNKYMIAGIVVLGLIIYLILAFFVKEKNCLRFFEKKCALMNILESFVVLISLGLLFFVLFETNIMTAIFFVLILGCIYAISRFSGGRLCGILALVITLALMIILDLSSYMTLQDSIDVLSFLLPFTLFLAIHRVMIPAMGSSSVLIIAGYLVMSFIFSLAIAINPLVSVLFIGCLFSLLFAKPQKTTTRLVNGIYLGGLFIFFTVAFLAVIYFMMSELIHMPSLQFDNALNLSQLNGNTLTLVLGKYTKPIIYLSLPFRYGIAPTMIFFFSVLAGYYGLRKKSCYLSPMIFSFVGLWAYYILFCENGSAFHYLTFFLPVFAAYGFSNTLLAEETDTQEEPVAKQEEKDCEPIEEEVKESVEEEVEKEVKEENKEEINKTITEPITEKKDKNISIIPLEKKQDEIPEWTISESYLAKQQQVEDMLTDNMRTEDDVLPANITTSIMEENNEIEQEKEEQFDQLTQVTEGETLLEDADSLNLDELVAEESNEGNLSLTDDNEDENQLHNLLDRLDITESIQRMSESAQEDLADVIERDEEQVELSEALPLKPSNSTLPKYKKPDFDMHIEPVTIPLDDSYSNISEYDEVPTIHELESRWKEEKPVIETVATTIDENTTETSEETILEEIHSENIVKKNGMSKRSYHKITIR